MGSHPKSMLLADLPGFKNPLLNFKRKLFLAHPELVEHRYCFVICAKFLRYSTVHCIVQHSFIFGAWYLQGQQQRFPYAFADEIVFYNR